MRFPKSVLHCRGRRVVAVTMCAFTATLALAASAPAEVFRFSFSDPPTTVTLEPCGAVLTSRGEHSVQIVVNGNDEFVRWVQQDVYPGTITYQGRTYKATDRQVHIRYISHDQVPIGVLNGQGLFTHLAGIGVAVYDVGHLVFNDDTGATLLDSNKVIGFDEPFDFAAEICTALTGSAVKGAR
jgi:hypothetical protein